MNYQERSEIAKAANIIISSNDPRFDYHFVKDHTKLEEILSDATVPIVIPQHKYDYSIKMNEGTDAKLADLCPLSLASCGSNLDDIESFYRAKFPRLPDEYHGILARYSTEQVLTKKDVKNSIKKAKKKNEALPVGLSIAKMPIQIDFD